MVVVRIATPAGVVPASIKQVLLKVLFNRVLEQDMHILEAVSQHKAYIRQVGGEFPPILSTSLDLLPPWLAQLVYTQEPVVLLPTQVVIEL